MVRIYKPVGPFRDKAAAPMTETKDQPENEERPLKKQKDGTDGQ